MSQSPTTRQETDGRVRRAATNAIKAPVKQAVREALAEGIAPTPNGDATGDGGSHGTDGNTVADGAENASGSADASDEGSQSSGDADSTGSGSGDGADDSSGSRSLPRRILGSRRSVAVFALVAAVLFLRRRRAGDTDQSTDADQ